MYCPHAKMIPLYNVYATIVLANWKREQIFHNPRITSGQDLSFLYNEQGRTEHFDAKTMIKQTNSKRIAWHFCDLIPLIAIFMISDIVDICLLTSRESPMYLQRCRYLHCLGVHCNSLKSAEVYLIKIHIVWLDKTWMNK